MKFRFGFISNSSSTSFIVCNTSGEKKTIVDFVKENPHLIADFRDQYDWNTEEGGYTQEKLIESAEGQNIEFDPGEEKQCVFGDESGTLIGEVFDYILRGGGSSESFTWRFDEYYR